MIDRSQPCEQTSLRGIRNTQGLPMHDISYTCFVITDSIQSRKLTQLAIKTSKTAPCHCCMHTAHAARMGRIQPSMSALLVIMPMMSWKEVRSSSLGMVAFLEPCFSHSLNLTCRLFVNAGDAWPADAEMSHSSFSAAYLQQHNNLGRALKDDQDVSQCCDFLHFALLLTAVVSRRAGQA